eukprot:jgi/Mesen1/7007/ME000365S06139
MVQALLPFRQVVAPSLDFRNRTLHAISPTSSVIVSFTSLRKQSGSSFGVLKLSNEHIPALDLDGRLSHQFYDRAHTLDARKTCQRRSVASRAQSTDASSLPKARLRAHREEDLELQELERPLAEYMSLPASQYSVLDAERIERVDDKTFKCYAHRLKLFAFEVCPVLLVRVDEQPNGCCIRLLSCTLEGSPLVVSQNKKFSASMTNSVSWKESEQSPSARLLVSDTVIEVTLDIPLAFRMISVEAIEATGNKVLSQLLRVMLPRFLEQLQKDYQAWASGDETRKPLGTGEL